VIDQDLGHSVASAADRAGFQRLVAEVGLVLGLEVSRLARSSSDWHRLLEICALTGTLILDEDGLVVMPESVALTLAVQDELVARTAEAARLRQLQVERAQYEAELAQRRYLRVDPVGGGCAGGGVKSQSTPPRGAA
jgi:DNA invertase Pin-like site-specific DNA recombinase